mgnify:CR=1 FL=1
MLALLHDAPDAGAAAAADHGGGHRVPEQAVGEEIARRHRGLPATRRGLEKTMPAAWTIDSWRSKPIVQVPDSTS